MAGCCQQRVDRIAMVAEEMVFAKPAVVFGVSDHRLDRRSAPEFAFHVRRKPLSSPGKHDPGRALVVVAAIALVDVSALDPVDCVSSGDGRSYRCFAASPFNDGCDLFTMHSPSPM